MVIRVTVDQRVSISHHHTDTRKREDFGLRAGQCGVPQAVCDPGNMACPSVRTQCHFQLLPVSGTWCSWSADWLASGCPSDSICSGQGVDQRLKYCLYLSCVLVLSVFCFFCYLQHPLNNAILMWKHLVRSSCKYNYIVKYI